MPHIGDNPSLPFSGSTPITRHCSHQGAVASLPRAGSQSWRIYLALKESGRTMHELVADVDLPLATICARVNWLKQKGLIQAAGIRKGPHGVSNTVWART